MRAHSSDIALKASSKLIELAGSRGSQSQDGLDRFWRNARVHTLHDAARWKYYLLGTTFLTVFYHLVGDIVMADFKAKRFY